MAELCLNLSLLPSLLYRGLTSNSLGIGINSPYSSLALKKSPKIGL